MLRRSAFYCVRAHCVRAVCVGAALLLSCLMPAAAQAQSSASDAPLELGAQKPVAKPARQAASKVTAQTPNQAPNKVKPKPAPDVLTSTAPPTPPHEKTLLEAAKIVAAPAVVPDFVRNSRPPDDKVDYIPLGRPVAEPSSTPMTRDQIKAQEAELDSIRYRHDAMSKRVAAPVATKSVAGEPVKAKAIKLGGGK